MWHKINLMSNKSYAPIINRERNLMGNVATGPLDLNG